MISHVVKYSEYVSVSFPTLVPVNLKTTFHWLGANKWSQRYLSLLANYSFPKMAL